MRRQEQENAQSKVLYELSSMILNILRSPAGTVDFSDVMPSPAAGSAAVGRRQMGLSQITPAGFASLLLGISLALMLCGSVTFFIGFLLMPWVLGLVMVFYVVGLVSSLSMIGRAVICQTTSSPPSSSSRASPRKDCTSWKLS